MEVKKSRDADLDRKRGQWFLLGLIAAFAMLFVALEWNTGDSDWTFFADDEDLEAEMELSPLKRDQDEVPMMIPQEKTVEKQQSEQLHLVENDVELPPEPQPLEEIKEPETLNLEDIGRQMIEKALERNGGNRKKAAQELGISDRTLYRRIKQYGLD